MIAALVAKTHTKADVALLTEMWSAGATIAEIAARFGVTHSTVSKWATRYGLPKRQPATSQDVPDPTPEEEAASLDSLALSPWVEQRARECREAHFAERRAESECNTSSKASKWNRGICLPKGGRHV